MGVLFLEGLPRDAANFQTFLHMCTPNHAQYALFALFALFAPLHHSCSPIPVFAQSVQFADTSHPCPSIYFFSFLGRCLKTNRNLFLSRKCFTKFLLLQAEGFLLVKASPEVSQNSKTQPLGRCLLELVAVSLSSMEKQESPSSL